MITATLSSWSVRARRKGLADLFFGQTAKLPSSGMKSLGRRSLRATSHSDPGVAAYVRH